MFKIVMIIWINYRDRKIIHSLYKNKQNVIRCKEIQEQDQIKQKWFLLIMCKINREDQGKCPRGNYSSGRKLRYAKIHRCHSHSHKKRG